MYLFAICYHYSSHFIKTDKKLKIVSLIEVHMRFKSIGILFLVIGSIIDMKEFSSVSDYLSVW